MKGESYNYLKVVEEWRNERSQIICKCKCICGHESIVPLYKLKSNRIKSCGCMRNELISKSKRKHGEWQTLLYSKWSGMKRRCNNKNDSHYESYGGRGIKVCKEWDDYEVFAEWAKMNNYSKNMTIDRIDLDKDYTPDNCRWIPMEEQPKNKRNTVYLIYEGKQKRMVEIAKEIGIRTKTLSSRYYRFKKRNPDVSDDSITVEMIEPTEVFKGMLKIN